MLLLLLTFCLFSTMPTQSALTPIDVKMSKVNFQDAYGDEIAPYVNLYANTYANGDIHRIIQTTSSPTRLLNFAALALETGQQELFSTIVKKIHDSDKKAINTSFSSGRTLLLSTVIAAREQTPRLRAMLKSLMKICGGNLDINAGSTKDRQDAKNIGTTPLFYVAQEGLQRICRDLLSREDINIEAVRSDGVSPFAIAAEYGHLEIMQMLYECAKKRGKPLNVNNQSLTTGSTPLMSSIGTKEDITTGKLVNVSDTVPRMLVNSYGADVNLPLTLTGASPLVFAAINGQFRLAEFFISKGAHIAHTLKDGSNVLHAITGKINLGYTQDAKLPTYELEGFLNCVLRDNSHLWTMQSRLGNAPLHNAVRGNDTLTRILLKTARALQIPDYQNVPTKTGRTSLHCAAAEGNALMIRLLLEHNADPYKTDNNGYSALDLAASCNQTAIHKIIAEKEEAEQQKKLSQRTKKHKKKRMALNTKHHESCPFCGSYVSCACASSANTTSSISSIPLAPKTAKALTKINATELLNYKFLSAPEEVCAMRNKSNDTLINNIVIGYKQNPSGECHPIDPSCYLCNNKEKDTGDKYHFLDRDFDPSIIGYGTQIPYNERAKHVALLEKYSITIHPGHTVYVMPGRIEAPWYDPMLALEHRDVVSSFGGSHNGAFVIAMDHNRKIRHKQFHPTAEQKAVHSYWKNNH